MYPSTDVVYNMNSRQSWIDALRAIAMIFVIYGHQVPEWTEYFVVTSPIKICLFFAITGYVFKEKIEERVFYNGIITKLLIPWLFFTIVPYAMLIPFKGISFFLSRIISVLNGSAAWYIPCCIVAEIVWHYIHKSISSNRYIILVSILLFVLGIYLGNCNILNFWMINRALVAQLYLLIGWVIKKYNNRITELVKKRVLISFLIIYVSLCIITVYLYPGQNLDVHTNEYYNILICLIMIWVGNILAFNIAEMLFKNVPTFLTLIGTNTLFIYLSHDYVIYMFRLFIERANMTSICDYRVIALIVTVITCFLCTAISIVLKRVCPVLFGLKNN